jgi:uncharacterized repeat protein (TIGR03803 family)
MAQKISSPLVAVTSFLLILLSARSTQAQTFTVLYNFDGGSQGAYPSYGSLVEDSAGNLYGTTNSGGSFGWGTVFKVVPSTGTETVLYNFTGGADGGAPYCTLALSGNALYGTTPDGGSKSYGVVFVVNITTGAEKVLYNFTGGADGAYPKGGPVLSSGALYGTTSAGGSLGYGVIYKVVVKTGAETVLHTFDQSDGAYPFSSLTLSKTGNILYGATPSGGSLGYGVVFGLSTNGSGYKVLYNFTGADGEGPYGRVALDAAGNVYGATIYGGTFGFGVVFKVVPRSGTETVLYNFTGGADGGNPQGGVVRSQAGALYGTAEYGGANGFGTVFSVVSGTETVLHSFDSSDGADPLSGVIVDSKDNLYGTANHGGSDGAGVVWEIEP